MEQFPFSTDGFNESVLKLYKDIFKAIKGHLKLKRKRANKDKPLEKDRHY